MRQASLITLGCKVNSFDTALIWEGLESQGFMVSDRMEVADLYIINTCTVTNNAGSQSRQVIRKARKMNPESVVIVTGCHAQVSPEDVSSIDGVDYVLGNIEKKDIFDFIKKTGLAEEERIHVEERVHVSDIRKTKELKYERLGSFLKKSRAVLKIQDGCEAFCTYCIIPYARGRSRSLTTENIVDQVLVLAGKGFREIVLTGIHLGGYGHDLPEKESLLSLLRTLDELNVDMRFRLSSIEPNEIDDAMVDFLVSSKKICRHLHIPLQSGDTRILEKMGRRYTPSYYLDKVETIASRWKDVSIGADIIAGFPGEDDKAFMNGYNLLKDAPVSYLHVFPYSKRDGTPAATMSDHVDAGEIKERCAGLRALGEEKKNAYCRNFLGKRLNVVSIEKREECLKTLSGNYINILVASGINPSNSRFDVEIDKVAGSICYGSVIETQVYP